MKVGDVVRVHTALAKPPKDKIALFVGNGLFLWFNTDARRDRPAQLPVAAHEVQGISRDCFLDCGRVTTFPPRELQSAVPLGRASTQFLQRVIQEIEQRATTLTNAQRRTIAATLKAAIQVPRG